MSADWVGKLEYVYGKVESDYDEQELGTAIKPYIDEYLRWELLGYIDEDKMPHHAYLPYMYSNRDSNGADGKAVTDPLTIYINLQIGADIDGIGFKTNLPELIDDVFDGHDYGGYISTKEVKIFSDIKDALYKEIQKIDKWIAEAQHVEEYTE